MYQSAAEEALKLSQISCYFNRRAKAEINMDISRVYHNWDLLNYSRALSMLRAMLARYDKSIDPAKFTELLKRQIEILEELNRAETDEITVLTDIYYNAQRRFYRDAYADTPLPGYGGLLRGAFTIVCEMYMVLNPGILT